MEALESLRGGASLLLVENTGRFAEVASILMPHVGEILSSDAPAEVILSRLKASMDEESLGEFMEKDFGKETVPEKDDFIVYRDYLMRFLNLAAAHQDKISVTELDLLESALDGMLSSGAA